jgi:CheY-like chemotaxis protein
MKKPPPSDESAPESLTASWAAEINSPLAVIVANVDYVVERLRSGQPSLEACVHDAREPLDEVRAAAHRIRDVVRHMVSNLPTLRPVADEAKSAGSPPRARGEKRVPSTVPPPSGTATRQERILIIDDDVALGRALRRALRDYDVVALVDAREALTRISDGERFDFILCDVMMPELTGVDFYEKVVLLAPDQAERIVFMTGGTTTSRTAAFLSTTANPVLQKPLEVHSLRGLVQDRLAGIGRAAPGKA